MESNNQVFLLAGYLQHSGGLLIYILEAAYTKKQPENTKKSS